MPAAATGSIPPAHHVGYARGYLELGLLKAAAEELRQIPREARQSAEVLKVTIELHTASKAWSRLVPPARRLARQHPHESQGWVMWAYALRELEDVAGAQAVLLEAEPLHPRLGVLHYNLACYACLLGDLDTARRRLKHALRLDRTLVAGAPADPDLRRLQLADEVVD